MAHMIKTDIYNFCNLASNLCESLDKRYSHFFYYMMFALSGEVKIIYSSRILVGIFAPYRKPDGSTGRCKKVDAF